MGDVAAEGVIIDDEVALAVEKAERPRGANVKRKTHAKKVRRMRRDDIFARILRWMRREKSKTRGGNSLKSVQS